MKIATVLTVLLGMCLSATLSKGYAEKIEADAVVEHYSKLVYQSYQQTYQDGLELQKAIATFLTEPTELHLQQAKKAWLIARDSYGQTESYRFYDGPIDAPATESSPEGPEARLNAWPVNEAYIDYVAGNMESGIVQDKNTVISKEKLSQSNQLYDEADVATGYHAIEFLLWGQDLSLEGPGMRPVSDYTDIAKNKRRREYLTIVTELLVEDLHSLVVAWEPGKTDNYAHYFTTIETSEALKKMMKGLITLSGFELASERMATALDSGDQEDEHSCFSDNTHNDFIMNALAISNVFFGEFGPLKGPSLHDLLKEHDSQLAEKLAEHIKTTVTQIRELPYPVDREILSTAEGSTGRKKMEEAIASLQEQAELLKKAAEVLAIQ